MSRKRENPQGVDLAGVAKKRSLLPLAPHTFNESEAALTNAKQLGLKVQYKRRKKGRRGKPPPKAVGPEPIPLPPVALSPEVLASIMCLSGVMWEEEQWHDAVVTPILHPQLCRQRADISKIMQSRCTGFRGGCGQQSVNTKESDHGKCMCIGTITCRLHGSLDLGGVFREGCQNVRLGLVVKMSSSREGEVEWHIKLQVGVEVWCIPAMIDTSLAGTPFATLKQLFTATCSVVKLFLPLDNSCGHVDSLLLEFWATEKICNFSFPSDPTIKIPVVVGCVKERVVESIHLLVKTLYPEYLSQEEDKQYLVSDDGASSSTITQVQQFYRKVQQGKRNQHSPSLAFIPGLKARLRKYQEQAVAWMLEREGVGGGDNTTLCKGGFGKDGKPRHIHILWRQLSGPATAQTPDVFFNPYTNRFSSSFFPDRPFPFGGILADEMGLGKTVEMLALVLAHKCPSPPEFHPTIGPHHHRYHRCDVAPTVVGGPDSRKSDSSHRIVCLCLDTRPAFLESLVQCTRCLCWQHVGCCRFNNENGGVFVCTKCLLLEPIPSRTTLIICPQAIVNQWEEEILKHTGNDSLNILVYLGVSTWYIPPLQMASYDIVLASYEVLRSELHHVTCQDFYKKLRHPKRFGCLPSPLPAVYWWRICLDEAQMVESTTVMAAKMVATLRAENRWCVTGTPVQKDLRDLFGLILFLGADPYHNFYWYQRLLWGPLLKGEDSPMTDLFSRLMWRNSKEDVAIELQLPPLSKKVHFVTFTSVEEYFYCRQQEKCMSKFHNLSTFVSIDTALSALQQNTMNEFLIPLHSLRQTCCTPEVVRSAYLTRETKRTPLSMRNLLGKLIMQAKTDARDVLRQLVSALNGLAGIHILEDKMCDAVACYCEAMSLWQEYGEQDVDCDKLQRIHALENLAGLLMENPHLGQDGCVNTDQLTTKATQLRMEYSTRVDLDVKAAVGVLVAGKRASDTARGKAQVAMQEFVRHHPPPPGVRYGGCGLITDSPPPSVCEFECEENMDSAMDENGNSTPTMDDPALPADGSTPPADNSTLPADDSALPADGSTPPADDSALPADGSTPPADNSILPADDSTPLTDALSSDPTPPADDSTPPADDSTLPADDSTPPADDSTLPADDSTPPADDSTLPADDSTPPADNSTLPADDSTPLSGDPTPPADDSTPLTGDPTPPADDSTPLTDDPIPLIDAAPPWWVMVGAWCTDKHKIEALLQSINTEHLNPDNPSLSIPDFYDFDRLRCFLALRMDSIENFREMSCHVLEVLADPPTSEEVQGAVMCHITFQQAKKCECCRGEQTILEYEGHLFSSSLETYVEGSRSPSNLESVLKCMVSFCKRNGFPKALVDGGHVLMAYLEALRKEYPAMRALWMTLVERLRILYELQQASTRLRLATQYDHISCPQAIPYADIPYHIEYMCVEKEQSKAKLKKCMGQVIYLKSLEKFQDEKEGNKEMCPICTTEMGKEWGMFPCGHSTCLECTNTLIRRSPGYTPCPLCRETCAPRDINYVRLEEESDCQDEVTVAGVYASKIVAVAQTLLRIKNQDPGAKALVYSSWQDVLTHISTCLLENNIHHRLVNSKSSFQKSLETFQTDPDINVLLIPFQSGSKGLNIVEATHVLLVEPQLNVSTELQAIGRVHRMGQTRPTTVHRFIVQHSVEERLHNLLHEDRKKAAANPLLDDSTPNLTCADVRKLIGGDVRQPSPPPVRTSPGPSSGTI